MCKHLHATRILVLERDTISDTSGGVQLQRGTTFAVGEDGIVYKHRIYDGSDYEAACDRECWPFNDLTDGSCTLWRDHWTVFVEPFQMQHLALGSYYLDALHSPVRNVSDGVVIDSLLQAAVA